jgi:hypothetical protein
MKFKCPLCKKILHRNKRNLVTRMFIKNGKYVGFCNKFGKDVLCREVK